MVAVDWVVPKSQYEEAKLASVQDSDEDNSDEVQSSHSADEWNSITEQSDQEGQANDDNDDIGPEDDDAASCSDTEDSDKPINEQGEDDEKAENLAEDKAKTLHRKKKMKNDVVEGRTIFIRYVCIRIGNS